ncbi:MAG: hypothetical protein ACYS99_08305 [Planctomycetota bacterium]
MGPRDRATSAVVLLALCAGLAACKSPPEPPPPFVGPDVTTEVTHFAGSPVSGPQPARSIGPDAPFHQVLVDFYAVERFPDTFGVPAASRARLVIDLARAGADRPLLPAARAGERVRVALGKEAGRGFLEELEKVRFGRHVRLGTLRGVLAPGLTSVFSVTGEEGVVRIQVHRNAGDLAIAPKDVQVALVAGGAEACLIDSERDGDIHVLVAAFPSPFPGGTGEGVLAAIEVSPPPTDAPERAEHEAAVVRCVEDAVRAAAASPRIEPIRVPVWTGLSAALAGVADPGTRRSALAYLARKTGAPLAEDSALSAPEEVVEDIARRIGQVETPEEPSALGLLLERAAYGAAGAAVEAEEPSARCEALLLAHAGELGRHPDLVEEVLAKAGSVEDIHEILVRENLIFLTSSSPAARVRAHDWLSVSGPVPEGYDPLGPRDERRRAVSRFLEAATESGAVR